MFRWRVSLVATVVAFILVAVTVPAWLGSLGTALAVEEPLAPADAALVLEGTGAEAPTVAESWRQAGLVRDVVIVEAPVKTHALIAYWSDFVRWGLAPPAPTPAEHLAVVRAATTQGTEQAQAALPALEAFGAHSVLVPGGGGIGSRLIDNQLNSVFGGIGITERMVRYGSIGRDPARWYLNAEDRRAVLDSWLQLVAPFLSGYEDGT